MRLSLRERKAEKGSDCRFKLSLAGQAMLWQIYISCQFLIQVFRGPAQRHVYGSRLNTSGEYEIDMTQALFLKIELLEGHSNESVYPLFVCMMARAAS